MAGSRQAGTISGNEALVIGDNVTVTVLGVKGNQVRIGVDAPKDVSVHREELASKGDANEQSSVELSDD